MKKAIFIIACMFSVFGSSFGQTVTDTLYITPQQSSHIVIRALYDHGTTEYDLPIEGNEGAAVGRVYWNGNEFNDYYSFYNFTKQPLPAGSNITSIIIHSTTSKRNLDRTLEVRKVYFTGTTLKSKIEDYYRGQTVLFLSYGDNYVADSEHHYLKDWYNDPSPTEDYIKLGTTLYTPLENQPPDTSKLSLVMMVIYERPAEQVTYIAKNVMGTDYNGGSIGVGVNEPPIVHQSPDTLTVMENDTLNLSASHNINPNTNTHYIFNEIIASAVRSNWQITYKGNIHIPSYETSCSIISEKYIGKNILANLTPAWPVTLNYSTEFNDTFTKEDYVAKGNTSTVTAPLNETINNKPYKFAGWTDNSSTSNVRTLTPTGNTTITPRYKYPTHSNQANGYSSNSQRKVIKTTVDGYLHNVYQSMGRVWYEKSTDNGTNWQIMNNGCSLSSSNAKNPSITAVGNGSNVLIAFQEESGTNYNIKIISVNYLVNQIQDTKFVIVDRPYTDESHPIAYYASYQYERHLLLCWEQKDDGLWNPGGIYYLIGNMTGLAGQEINLDPSNASHIANTDNSYCNPTLMGSLEHSGCFSYCISTGSGS